MAGGRLCLDHISQGSMLANWKNSLTYGKSFVCVDNYQALDIDTQNVQHKYYKTKLNDALTTEIEIFKSCISFGFGFQTGFLK